jgi:acetolactate synthase-1/3 small subunit
MNRHVISVLVENHSGALSRIAGLFSSRGYNISNLSVAETEDPTVSRMTIVVDGEESILEQIVKQLNRLIDVIKVIDFTDEKVVMRELILVRVDVTKASRHEVVEVCTIFGARIASTSLSALVLEFTGTTESVDDFITMLKPFGIKELVRSGISAIGQTRK